ncbi:hypothetical protein Ciccas_011197 [Cichlidogyrus casuarinus]|uniref:G-protein coupled receptors family 1 profile domain-containing protein n=1 Tax=Cichlidogyrus casuarinus TaxID=1844966 RepID=A0ABD2PUU5_9PLAT
MSTCNQTGEVDLSLQTRLYAIPIIFVGLCSIVGNSVVIAVLSTDNALKPMRHASNHVLFMFSLAISDLGSGLLFLCTSAKYALLQKAPSSIELQIGAGFKYLFMTNSLLALIGISIDKLMYIQYPYAYGRVWNRKRCLVYLLLQWLLIGSMSLLPTGIFAIPNYCYIFRNTTYDFETKHEADVSALVIVRIVLFLIMLLTLCFGYGRVWCITRSKLRKTPYMATDPDNSSFNATWRLRGMKMIVIIVTMFILLFLPYFIIMTIFAMPKINMGSKQAVLYSVTWFAMLYTCVNVLIYSFAYKPFRKGLRDLFRRNKTRRISLPQRGGLVSTTPKIPDEYDTHLYASQQKVSS